MVSDGEVLRLAVIPARGGSKRIPRKNIKAFHGKPIMAYSIEAARNSGLFDEVMVSTDDEEIALIAERYGASVPFLGVRKRPAIMLPRQMFSLRCLRIIAK